VEETLQGRTVRFLGKKMEHDSIHGIRKAGGARLDMPKIRKNPFIEVIPINTGCLNQCTYCKTKHARGDLGSYHPDAIVQRVKSVLEGNIH
jgi:threonylcarbamoyladenosine tRNA methylthiotransferase CDKAL1